MYRCIICCKMLSFIFLRIPLRACHALFFYFKEILPVNILKHKFITFKKFSPSFLFIFFFILFLILFSYNNCDLFVLLLLESVILKYLSTTNEEVNLFFFSSNVVDNISKIFSSYFASCRKGVKM